MSDEVLLDLCRALVSTVRSGLALSDAFETLARSPRYGRLIAGAAEMTAGGAPLHEAFAAQRAFPPVFTALLRAGEESGKTDEFLELYADCLEVRVKFRRQLQRLLVYPVFVAALAAALFLLVSFKVVPLVMEPLLSSGAALPPQAFLFTTAAEILYGAWYKILLAGSLTILVLRWLLLSAPGRIAAGLAGHLLPLYRFAVEEARFYYLYTTIGLLLKAGLPTGAMMEVLLQFSREDLVTRRRLRRASGLLAGGAGFTESISGLLQQDDRRAMEIAEKAGRLDDTMLARGKLHYDRHLHRLKLLVTGFNISTMVAIAMVCFGLILTVAWPALSVMGGAKDTLRGIREAENGRTAPLSAEDARTGTFNEKYAREAADLLQNGKNAAQGRAAKNGRKKLAPAAPISRIQLKKAAPTSIQPSNIDTH